MAIVDGSLQLGYKDSAWFTANASVVLLVGQIVYLQQTGTYKIGDGVTALSALSFLGGGSSTTPTLQQVTDEGATTTNPITADAFYNTLGTVSLYTDGISVLQSDDATPLFDADRLTDTIKYKTVEIATLNDVNSKLPIQATQTTGVALTFLTDSVYGTIGTPETGNITYSATNAKIGVTNLIIHNNGTAPTFAANMKQLSGSSGYSLGVVNYIFVTYINSTEVIYSINQRT
jgi:hypothetical protein